jgi:hypothetical protein
MYFSTALDSGCEGGLTSKIRGGRSEIRDRTGVIDKGHSDGGSAANATAERDETRTSTSEGNLYRCSPYKLPMSARMRTGACVNAAPNMKDGRGKGKDGMVVNEWIQRYIVLEPYCVAAKAHRRCPKLEKRLWSRETGHGTREMSSIFSESYCARGRIVNVNVELDAYEAFDAMRRENCEKGRTLIVVICNWALLFSWPLCPERTSDAHLTADGL